MLFFYAFIGKLRRGNNKRNRFPGKCSKEALIKKAEIRRKFLRLDKRDYRIKEIQEIVKRMILKS